MALAVVQLSMRQTMKVAFIIISLIIGATAAHAEHLIIRSPVSLDDRFYAVTDFSQCIAAGSGNFSAYIDDKGVIETIGTRRDIFDFQNCLIKMGADLPSGTPRNRAMSAR
jgi:hypothetical protein